MLLLLLLLLLLFSVCVTTLPVQRTPFRSRTSSGRTRRPTSARSSSPSTTRFEFSFWNFLLLISKSSFLDLAVPSYRLSGAATICSRCYTRDFISQLGERGRGFEPTSSSTKIAPFPNLTIWILRVLRIDK